MWSNQGGWQGLNSWGRPVVVVGGGTTTFDPSNITANVTLSGGNLVATGGGGSATSRGVRSISGHSTGKYYAEFTMTTADGSNASIGIINSSYVIGTTSPNTANTSEAFESGQVQYAGGTASDSNGTVVIGSYTSGDMVSIALDLTNKKIWFRKNNGLWNQAGGEDPATNLSGIDITTIQTGTMYIFASMQSAGVWTANFGGSAYAQSVPSGFGNW